MLAPLDGTIFILAVRLIVEAALALRTPVRVAYDEMGSPVGQEPEEPSRR